MRSYAFAAFVGAAACAGPLSSEISPPLDSLPTVSVADCPRFDPSTVGPIDVVFAIDASRSTLDPTGEDINGNGKTGRPIISRVGGAFDLGSTDPGDSFLVAQVVAARSVLQAFRNAGARFGIVSFSDSSREQVRHPVAQAGDGSHESALERILANGSGGDTDFAAGLSDAYEALAGAPSGGNRYLALLMSDTLAPVPSADPRASPRIDPAVERGVVRAASAGIVFNTFAIGDRAAGDPNHLRAIARGTGGTFSRVDARELPCALASSLSN